MSTVRRAGRRTNLALAVALPVAFASGWVAFGTGTVWPARVVTAIHAAAGLALLLLVPWKQLIVRRGLRRRPRRWATKAASLALAFFVLLSLAAGLTHSYLGEHEWFGLSTMQVHVGAAVVAAVLFAVHLATRWPRVRATDLSRRNALRLGGLAVAATASYALLEGLARLLPGDRRRATGSFDAGPGPMPQVAWLFDEIPAIDPADRAVTVTAGGVTRRVDVGTGTDEVRAILDCTSGWYAERTWRGVRLDRLLGAAGGSVVVTSATGYRRRFPAAEASALWLAVAADGVPLDAGHGAPVRLVAPGRRGFWWVKWVATVEVEGGPDWWQPPFPLQ